jgi:glycerol-3-phosphate acyltransferase PlsX
VRIAVDAMGGDRAPDAIVTGALLAAADPKLEITLVGRQESVEPLLMRAGKVARGAVARQQVRIVHAAEVIGMDEPPAQAVRRKKDASVVVCAELVRAGEADAFVSAGHSGACMAAALRKLGRIPGVDRPAIATELPSLSPAGRVVVLDAGANPDCDPHNLLQFAVMGSIYAEEVLGIRHPKVGLLSNGEEDCKGNELTRATFPLLAEAPICFAGNIEGRELFNGKADVVVCDGFTGNVLLKVGEGVAELLERMVKEELARAPWLKLPGLFIAPALKRIRRRTHYASYGGAPLLGVNGVCIISHGRSNPTAMANAIRAAGEAACHDIVAKIGSHAGGASAGEAGVGGG